MATDFCCNSIKSTFSCRSILLHISLSIIAVTVFEGMTLKTRTIDSGFDNEGAGSSDGASFNSDVLEIGLPNTVSYSNVSYTLANSNEARPTDSGFQQTDILNVKIDGNVALRGNLLLFPTGNP